MTLRIRKSEPSTDYPWHRCKPGESFFIPTLNPQLVRVRGMEVGTQLLGQEGLRSRIGVHDGMLGVLFSVLLPRPSK